jgi:ribosomal protein L11 methyltransferase
VKSILEFFIRKDYFSNFWQSQTDFIENRFRLMTHPYQHLVIYYFEGTVRVDTDIAADPRFLGLWEEAGTAFLFFSRPVPDLAGRITTGNPGAQFRDVYEMTWEQWHGDAVKPYDVADFRIFPPWDVPKDMAGRRPIMMDPGVVFGTGRHPTTHACLDLIHRICTSGSIETVLDIGTGTGLLALGAAAMGCSRVLACDFNLLAVATTRKNIALNHWDDRILAFQARGETMLDLPCDLVVANIHYDIMRQLIDSPAFMEKPWVILSGLLRTEARHVADDLTHKQVDILEHHCPDGIWHTFLARPRAGSPSTNATPSGAAKPSPHRPGAAPSSSVPSQKRITP